MNRPDVTDKSIDSAEKQLSIWLQKRLNRKGYGSFASIHEALGVLTEEYTELVEAVHSKDQDDIYWELRDIAVGAVFAMACMEDGTMEW